METAALIGLAIALAGAIAGLVYFGKRAFGYADQVIALSKSEANEKVEAERSSFEAASSKASLEDANTKNTDLEEALQAHVDETPAADLAPDDLAGRVQLAEHAAAGDAGNPLPAVAGAPVLATEGKAGAGAAGVSGSSGPQSR